MGSSLWAGEQDALCPGAQGHPTPSPGHTPGVGAVPKKTKLGVWEIFTFIFPDSDKDELSLFSPWLLRNHQELPAC